jgi:hypothetical protein
MQTSDWVFHTMEIKVRDAFIYTVDSTHKRYKDNAVGWFLKQGHRSIWSIVTLFQRAEHRLLRSLLPFFTS